MRATLRRGALWFGLCAAAGAWADTPSIDLTVTALSGAPATAPAGSSFPVSSTVKTTGAVTRSFTVGFYLSTDATITTADTLVGSRTVASLARNGTSSATTTVTVPAGLVPRAYWLGAIVDSGRVVAESNENNNSRTGTSVQVTGAGGVDLTVTALWGAPATALPGGTFALSDTVAAAPAGAAGAFTVGFYLSSDAVITTTDTLVGSRLVGSLVAGATSSATTTVTVPAGLAAATYYVGAIADSLGQVVETSESNNTFTGAQVRVLRPDLAVTSLSGVPARIGVGDGFTVSDSVANDPSGAAAGPFTVGYYLSATSNVTTAGVLLGSRAVTGLAAGQVSTASTALTIPASLPPGTWYLGAIADTGSVVAESIETNNVAVTAAFEVGSISCQQPPEPIDDGNPCTVDSCDPVLGIAHVPAAAGSTCSDGNYCNGAESCDGAGSCLAGLPPAVDDGNACTADTCDPATGVWHAPLAAGTSCSDANACNGAETCDGAGACLAGTPPSVDDANACTADACDPLLGVLHTQIPGCVVLPPDPVAVAPAHDLTVATDLASSTSFLYSGANPIQTGVAPGTIEAKRVAVVRGSVRARGGAALSGAEVTVLGHPELGGTLSRADGSYDLAVNGGETLTLQLRRDGYLPVQRQVDAPWRDYVRAPDVALVPFDTAVTAIQPGAASLQVARGTAATDLDGTRQATLMFQAGTQATMQLANGATQPLSTFHVRATEYTVGSEGRATMPAPLPPTTGYTYAVELSVDEAVAAGARSVVFDRPVPVYLENFLGAPAGTLVPAGYYDRELGAWVPSTDGLVIAVLGITGGLASIDADGDGLAETAAGLTALGVSAEELAQLASLYLPGQTLWRVPVGHFTSWDFNYAYGCPEDSDGQACPTPETKDPKVAQREDNPDCRSGSVIECQNQVLGEEIPIAGTPYRLVYRSGSQPGRSAERTLTITLPTRVSSRALGLAVEIEVAGQRIRHDLPAAAGGTIDFTWNGKDAYGRQVQGGVPVTVRVGQKFRPALAIQNISSRAAGGGGGGGGPGGVLSGVYRSFGDACYHAETCGSLTREGDILISWWTWKGTLFGWATAQATGLGGWTLSAHHAYDPSTRFLMLGDGRTRTAAQISHAVVTGSGSVSGTPSGLSVGPDGSIYAAAYWNVSKISPSGALSILAGYGSASPPQYGAPATQSSLQTVMDVAVGPDGSVYFAHYMEVARVRPDGILERVAGDRSLPFTALGDGGPAVSAYLGPVASIALAPDGSLYILASDRVRKVSPDGLIRTIAGGVDCWTPSGYRTCCDTGDGGPAENAGICGGSAIGRLAVGPDGSVYVVSESVHKVRRIRPDGFIETVAGTGVAGFSGDGGPARAAQLYGPAGVAVRRDGSLYIADRLNVRVRRVASDGTIDTVGGNGAVGEPGEGGPAVLTSFRNIYHAVPHPNGDILVADLTYSRISKIGPPLTGFSAGDIAVASEDGRELYAFDWQGRHMRTADATTGATLLTFGYGPTGMLASITDADGNATSIERDGTGRPSAIVAPRGQRTLLAHDGQGYLGTVTNPAGEVARFTYDTNGMMQSYTDARNEVHTFQHDAAGRLISDANPAGGAKTLSRTETAGGYGVAVSTALGRTTVHEVAGTVTGDRTLTTTAPDGTRRVRVEKADSSTVITSADGTVATTSRGPDPRFGMVAPVTTATVTTPGGRAFSAAETRTATLADPRNPLSHTALGETLTVNGRAWSQSYASATRQVTSRTPAGRTAVTTLDLKGKPARIAPPGVPAIDLAYDASGRLEWATQGARTLHVEYDAAGLPWRLTDPLSRQVTLEYDQAGRVWRQTLPGGRQVTFGRDPNGNLTSLAPPGRQAHGFGYWPGDAVKSYDPPPASPGGPLWPTGYGYDLDGALTSVALPDGTSIAPVYDATTGRLSSVTIAHGSVGVGYDPQGRVSAVSTAEESLGYGHDGFLMTSETFTGAVSGAVGYGYDNDFRVTSQSVNGAAVSFGYDADGLLTSAGALAIGREAATGRISGSTLGTVTTSQTYTSYGEPWATTARVGGSAVYSYTLERSALSSRIEGKTETIGGVTTTTGYGYDAAGRLETVTVNGTLAATYGYDQNGNRTSRTTAGGTELGVADEQDRLTSYGGASYTYRTPGALESRTDGAGTTWYDYDALGSLRAVLLPDGRRLDYVVDGQGRRIGKRVNGILAEGFLYEGKLRPVAWLDGAGQVKARFVYGTRVNVPEYMVTPAGTYRIITDHLGSPRLVVNSTTGAIAQRMDYDEWGVVLADSNPGFQPFGFAGGLYDRDTGLVRFGARDYEPRTGRWTNKDPIGFRGGLNVYEYVGGDPVNWTDPSGLYPGQMPPAPPGYDPSTWGSGTWWNGKPWVRSPDGRTFTAHTEDLGHWRHWDIEKPGGGDGGSWPSNPGKPRPGQKRLKGNQCGADPSGDAPEWSAPPPVQRLFDLPPLDEVPGPGNGGLPGPLFFPFPGGLPAPIIEPMPLPVPI